MLLLLRDRLLDDGSVGGLLVRTSQSLEYKFDVSTSSLLKILVLQRCDV